ncbi:DEAD/DEAH box helicase [Pedobacter montanisoli]|uniref:DEAD/DEAH box helicase n=1 Tax=Pedobacter montanisoli TaxID=2923277 RepID=A0ABS9ZVM7_9SPHI|nr:DEAD/DEAH box helicase [Pedobacter montanisoli]MCJ0742359.1 DEAD/DEAH box helicase [Pedobacter montanisoli]
MNLPQILSKLKIEQLNTMQLKVMEVFDKGNDVCLLSPTGSGKTLAFLLPLIKQLQHGISGVQALILVPTRELALQIETVFKQITTDFKINSCYGGHAYKTERNNLSHAPAVIVGTPGRIADHLSSGNFKAFNIRLLVLDEFDKSLEYGFADDMSYILLRLPENKQSLLTSATGIDHIPDFVKLSEPKELNFLGDKNSNSRLDQKVIFHHEIDKDEKLFKLLCKIGNQTTIIFCNYRDEVNKVSDYLIDKNLVHDIFHGGMEQYERERALLKVRNGSNQVLITTDLAARGIDIPEIKHVIHYQMPKTEEAFIHRNGRTARMQADGNAYLFLDTNEQVDYLKPDIKQENLDGHYGMPQDPYWKTLYINAGKKNKVNKIDIVGLLINKASLNKDDIGLIEVKDYDAYVAVKRDKVGEVLRSVADEKIKQKKIRIESAI